MSSQAPYTNNASRSRIRGQLQKNVSITVIGVLLTTRIARRWNQTGQKFAGEPDIARTFFVHNKAVLWISVVCTYMWNLLSLAKRGFPTTSQHIARGFATALTIASATFKLAFTSQDSPELMAGASGPLVATDLGLPLVIRARMVFFALALVLGYTLITGYGIKKYQNRMYLPREPATYLC